MLIEQIKTDLIQFARKAMILVVGPPKSWRLAAAAYKSASHDTSLSCD